MDFRELDTHRLPRFVFDEICSGAVSVDGMAILRRTQHSVRRLRLRAFLEAARPIGERLGPFADLDGAWALLASAERTAPEVVESVLMHHSVGVWLGRALRQVLGTAADATPLWSEVGWFHAVAAAAAVRADLPCDVTVPVVHGTVTIPSVGAFRLSRRFPVGQARVVNSAAGLSVEVPGVDTSVGWAKAKRLRGSARGYGFDVLVDDLEPYREFTGPVPPGPLDDATWDEWRKLLGETWELLAEHHRPQAEELAAGLAAVVPLDTRRDVFAASSSAAFGAIALSPKRSAVEFGEALVHEIQHSKVNALLDLVDLHTGDDEPVHYAPWRDDPRSLEGLLHGVYAFVSVAEYWHAQRGHVPASLARRAQFNLGHRARQVGAAVDGMRGLVELTDLGRRFVAGVAVRLAACAPDDLWPDVATAVDEITALHATTWRLRHVRPDPGAVDAAVTAWLDRRPAPVVDPRGGRVVPSAAAGDSALTALLRLRALDPDEFARLSYRRTPEHDYLRDDRVGAVRGFAARLLGAPHDSASWAGLGLALRSPTVRVMPEVVCAVHRGVAARAAAAPDPVALVAWFDRATR
ncbi:hypothetical protein CKY47_16635 [Saccharothrix yanglingensis]|uniref:HEXXH motif domain-containing protein n=1 Tax=Saccharothrix yanglingensis TaxID=659496 RepID=A0ABU0X0E6_9PSEU|nr:hypothetical protein [Saccharothrix yanglingensis]